MPGPFGDPGPSHPHTTNTSNRSRHDKELDDEETSTHPSPVPTQAGSGLTRYQTGLAERGLPALQAKASAPRGTGTEAPARGMAEGGKHRAG